MGVIVRYVRELLAKYDVQTPSQYTLARQLSGGNLQRLVIARESSRDLRLIIAANPIAGLDVGAAEYVHEQLLAQRQLGRAILLISADLDELFSMCDRIAVIYAGGIVSIVDASHTNMEEIGLMMGGVVGTLQDTYS